LFIAIAKHKDIENFLLWNLKGVPDSKGVKFILGINMLSPIFFLVITLAPKTFFPK